MSEQNQNQNNWVLFVGTFKLNVQSVQNTVINELLF